MHPFNPFTPDEAADIAAKARKLVSEPTVTLDVAAVDPTHRDHGDALIAVADGAYVRAWVFVPTEGGQP